MSLCSVALNFIEGKAWDVHGVSQLDKGPFEELCSMNVVSSICAAMLYPANSREENGSIFVYEFQNLGNQYASSL